MENKHIEILYMQSEYSYYNQWKLFMCTFRGLLNEEILESIWDAELERNDDFEFHCLLDRVFDAAVMRVKIDRKVYVDDVFGHLSPNSHDNVAPEFEKARFTGRVKEKRNFSGGEFRDFVKIQDQEKSRSPQNIENSVVNYHFINSVEIQSQSDISSSEADDDRQQLQAELEAKAVKDKRIRLGSLPGMGADANNHAKLLASQAAKAVESRNSILAVDPEQLRASKLSQNIESKSSPVATLQQQAKASNQDLSPNANRKVNFRNIAPIVSHPSSPSPLSSDSHISSSSHSNSPNEELSKKILEDEAEARRIEKVRACIVADEEVARRSRLLAEEEAKRREEEKERSRETAKAKAKKFEEERAKSKVFTPTSFTPQYKDTKRPVGVKNPPPPPPPPISHELTTAATKGNNNNTNSSSSNSNASSSNNKSTVSSQIPSDRRSLLTLQQPGQSSPSSTSDTTLTNNTKSVNVSASNSSSSSPENFPKPPPPPRLPKDRIIAVPPPNPNTDNQFKMTSVSDSVTDETEKRRLDEDAETRRLEKVRACVAADEEIERQKQERLRVAAEEETRKREEEKEKAREAAKAKAKRFEEERAKAESTREATTAAATTVGVLSQSQSLPQRGWSSHNRSPSKTLTATTKIVDNNATSTIVNSNSSGNSRITTTEATMKTSREITLPLTSSSSRTVLENRPKLANAASSWIKQTSITSPAEKDTILTQRQSNDNERTVVDLPSSSTTSTSTSKTLISRHLAVDTRYSSSDVTSLSSQSHGNAKKTGSDGNVDAISANIRQQENGTTTNLTKKMPVEENEAKRAVRKSPMQLPPPPPPPPLQVHCPPSPTNSNKSTNSTGNTTQASISTSSSSDFNDKFLAPKFERNEPDIGNKHHWVKLRSTVNVGVAVGTSKTLDRSFNSNKLFLKSSVRDKDGNFMTRSGEFFDNLTEEERRRVEEEIEARRLEKVRACISADEEIERQKQERLRVAAEEETRKREDEQRKAKENAKLRAKKFDEDRARLAVSNSNSNLGTKTLPKSKLSDTTTIS